MPLNRKAIYAGLALGSAMAVLPRPAAAGDGQSIAAAAVREIGATLYAQRCGNCHGRPGETTTLAPTLVGIVGRRAGSVAGFSYSARFAGSDHTWTTASLDRWLATVTIATPDLAARHLGVPDPFERQALIAYLAALER